MSKVKSAVSMFGKGYVCSQALLATYGTQFGLDREMALKLAAGFGGGMAHKGETCGAVTGAVMLIGLKHGKIKAKDKKARRKTYELVQEFIGQFESRHGSTRCRDLLGHDLSTPEGYDAAKKKKLFRRACPEYVKDAAEIVEQILDSEAA